MPDTGYDYWIASFCPNCRRWVGAVSKNWNPGARMKSKCRQCKRYVIYPKGASDLEWDAWKEVHCPICGRWVASISKNYDPKSKMRVKCKPCGVEVIFPVGKPSSPSRIMIQEPEG